MLTDAAGRLTGLFTDSDLARLFERRDEAALDRPIARRDGRQPDDRAERHAGGRRGDAAGDSGNSASCRWWTRRAGRSGWST